MQVFVKVLKGRMKEVIINTKKELENEEGILLKSDSINANTSENGLKEVPVI